MCKTAFSPIKTTENHLTTPLLTREQAIRGRFGDGSHVTKNASILETQEPSPYTIMLFIRQPGDSDFTTERFWKTRRANKTHPITVNR